MIEKLLGLFDGLSQGDLDKIPPAKRQQFADRCRHWADLAERRQEEPKSGVLSDLRRGQRQE